MTKKLELPAPALKVASKPLQKAAKGESSWQVSCNDTLFECFGELILYALAVVCLLAAVALCHRRYRRQRAGGYRKVPLTRCDCESPMRDAEMWRACDIEESGNLEMETLVRYPGALADRPGRPGHRRVASNASCSNLSLASFDDDDGIILDDYAPITALKAWARDMEARVKEVVPASSEVQAAVHMATMSIQTVVSPKSPHGSPKAAPSNGPTPGNLSPARGSPSTITGSIGGMPASGVPTGDSDGAAGASEGLGLGASLVPSRPRSSLHKVTQAWLGTIGGGASVLGVGGGASVLGVDEVDEVSLSVEELLHACHVATSVCGSFGPLMAPAVKNDQANFEKVRTAWEKLGKPPSLRQLLVAEVATRIHKPGGVLKDPSAAIALVWTRRSLAFQTALLEGITRKRDTPLSEVATGAYRVHLEPHHNWVLKSTFKMALGAMPKLDEFFARLGVGQEPGLDRQAVLADMSELVEAQQRVVDVIGTLLVALDLEKF